MTPSQPGASPIERLRSARRKAVDLAQVSPIKTSYLEAGGTLPLVVEPNLGEVNLAEWAGGNRSLIERELLKHGAILFRGFGVGSPAAFEQAAAAVCPDLFGEYGDLPRAGVGGKVYGSTPYPADQSILFHNESSHLPRWPMKIWFCCIKKARRGGETPILDTRKAYALLDAEVRERFRRKRLMYVRNFIDGLDVSWRQFFGTSSRLEVEAACRSAGIECEWRGDHHLRTRRVCPAVIGHPRTGEQLFFNQIQLHHVSCLAPDVRAALARTFGEEDLPRNVYYGDGTPIEDEVMAMVGGLYRQAAVSFAWEEGDVLMLDNMMIAHSRNPYEGERKIVVTMGEMVGAEEFGDDFRPRGIDA